MWYLACRVKQEFCRERAEPDAWSAWYPECGFVELRYKESNAARLGCHFWLPRQYCMKHCSQANGGTHIRDRNYAFAYLVSVE